MSEERAQSPWLIYIYIYTHTHTHTHTQISLTILLLSPHSLNFWRRQSIVYIFPFPKKEDKGMGIDFLLEKAKATHSNVLAWRIPGTEEPGGLPSMGSHSQTRLK